MREHNPLNASQPFIAKNRILGQINSLQLEKYPVNIFFQLLVSRAKRLLEFGKSMPYAKVENKPIIVAQQNELKLKLKLCATSDGIHVHITPVITKNTAIH